VLEAFVFRTPVVAANTTGLKEIVRHGENGLLFTDGDYEDLAKQIRAVLERPGLADKLRGNGLEEVMRRYNAERMVARYRRFFRSVLRRDK